jgi:uncharacterized protein (TIGR00661 family)
MGDSGGHINRSLAVAAEMPEHEFLFVGDGKTEMARSRGHGFVRVPMLATILKDSTVLLASTAAHFCRTILGYRSIIDSLCRAIRDFKPDLAVTDYEFFLPRAARKEGIPSVSLDHQHILTHCRYTVPPDERLNRLMTMASVRHLFSAADRHLVSSFYPLPPLEKNTEVIPPILHRDVLDASPENRDHVVVYMRTGMGNRLHDALASSKREFRIYGMNETGSSGNLRFLPPSRQGFLEDLASAAYVICNAGHTLTCEALQLGKPVLAFPTAYFYEQYFNAYHLDKMQYGRFAHPEGKCAGALTDFERELSVLRNNLTGINLFGNYTAAERLTSLAFSD